MRRLKLHFSGNKIGAQNDSIQNQNKANGATTNTNSNSTSDRRWSESSSSKYTADPNPSSFQSPVNSKGGTLLRDSSNLFSSSPAPSRLWNNDSGHSQQVRSSSQSSRQDTPVSRLQSGSLDLSNFDACIEACDALAASSGDHGHATCVNGASTRDCSVMVSPDGALLVVPRGHSSCQSSSSSRELFLGEEYESAVVMGRDLSPDQDLQVNGFSVLGWNPNRASRAIAKSADTMKNITYPFLADIYTSHRSHSSSLQLASDRLDQKIQVLHHHLQESEQTPPTKDSASSINAARKADAGPLLFPGSTLHNAFLALSQYYSKVAEGETKRWNGVSDTNMNSSSSFFFKNQKSHNVYSTPQKNTNMSARSPFHEYKNDKDTNGDALLRFLESSIDKSMQRSLRRERAIVEAERKLEQAERTIQQRKYEAKHKWARVQATELEIQQRLEETIRERNRIRQEQRLQEEFDRQAAVTGTGALLDANVSREEIWELVSQASEDYSSFAPTGLPKPSTLGPMDKSYNISQSQTFTSPLSHSSSFHKNHETQEYSIADHEHDSLPRSPSLSFSDDIREDLEIELGLCDLRLAAMQADELVEDAAGQLLNVLSHLDTTKRSARIAAETALLSTSNAQATTLKALVTLEREAINERLTLIERLEEAISKIDVRSDLKNFIEHDKKLIHGASTRLGNADDGGIASALAVLNCHSEGVGIGVGVSRTAGSYISSSSKIRDDCNTNSPQTMLSSYHEDICDKYDDSVEEEPFMDRDKIEKAVALLFEFDGAENTDNNDSAAQMESSPSDDDFNGAVEYLVKVTSDKKYCIRARACRASACYAINSQRGNKTQLNSLKQFYGLCKVLDAILSGCDRECADVANAKMCMMLSQTFYLALEKDDVTGSDSGRLFPKIKLCQHEIWSDDDFWTQALFQCVTDSLTTSGVMSNFERIDVTNQKPSSMQRSRQNNQVRKLRWHDLSSEERSEAASQVHAVIFAQLLALAHSMIEFGCTIDFACALVRRLSVRHQLPLSQRAILLHHITRKIDAFVKEDDI